MSRFVRKPPKSWRFFLHVRFKVGLQAGDHGFFLAILNFLHYLFQGKMNHIVVVQFQRCGGFAELQPQAMEQVHFVGGKIGACGQGPYRPCRRWPCEFQVELRLGIAQFLPRVTKMLCLLFGGLFGEWPTTIVLDWSEVAARKIASQISFDATTASRMVLPRFSAIESAWENRCCSMLRKVGKLQLILLRWLNAQQAHVHHHNIPPPGLDAVQNVCK